MMFNTYTISGNSKYSPGLILLRNIIDHYADRNYTSFDLGIGSMTTSCCSARAMSRSSTASCH